MQQYNVTGMSCAACSAAVEKAVNTVDGVSSCSVSLLTNTMGVEGNADSAQIIKAVQKAGYGASLLGETEKENADRDFLKDSETPKIRNRLIASLCFLPVLMYISMGHSMLGFPLPSFFEGNHIALALAQMIIAAIVMIINNKFFISGAKSLIHRSPNMDTLVALGSFSSFAWSVYALFRMTGAGENAAEYSHQLYFESAAMILALITVGKLLEAKSKGRTTDALKSLIKLKPSSARVIRNGEEREIAISELRVGDVFTLRAGEKIPADGIVLEGEGTVNESALTGESIPVDKLSGDSVTAATITQSGFLKCEAKKTGEDTALSQIIKTVTEAAATKAPIAKIADKVSGVFVPIVISLAVAVFIIWLIAGKDISFTLARAVSVLVISCPCALGLATPVAITVSNGLGAKNGILFKTAESLEQAGKIQIVVMDKTGTLTNGVPELTDIIACDEIGEKELLSLAYSLESKSEHPLAKAICRKCEQLNIDAEECEDYKTFSGNGISGTYLSKPAFGGKMEFIKKECEINSYLLKESERLALEGKTPLFFALDGKAAGIIAVLDTAKPDAEKTVKELKNMGIITVMLTGDNELTANAIGKALGFDKIIAGVLPNQKADVIKKLKKSGVTAMVGDGINDAPALTEADVGIAVGSGTDVAIESADVVLIKNKLSDVSAAVRLGRKALGTIKQNLFWAFFYNAVCIPVAAGVLIPRFGITLNPMMGAAAMSLSSFFVVTNALRINLFKIHSSKSDKKKECVNINRKKTEKEGENKMVIKVKGMMCPHCEARVKSEIEKLTGVESAVASHEKGEVEIFGSPDIEAVKKALTDAGYEFIG